MHRVCSIVVGTVLAVSLLPVAPGSALAATFSISGRVTEGAGGAIGYAAGDGIEGIVVSACPSTTPPAFDPVTFDCSHVESDAAGRWTVRGVAAGSYWIAFEDVAGDMRGWPPGWYGTGGFTRDASAVTPITLTTADVTGIDVGFPPVHLISGRLVGPGGEPIEGGSVFAESDPVVQYSPQGASDADGSFSIRVIPGTYHLSVYMHMSAAWLDGAYTSPTAGGALVPVVVASADVSGIVIVLERAADITGTVVGSTVPRIGAEFVWPHACTATGCEFARPPMPDGAWGAAVPAGTYRIQLDPFGEASAEALPGWWSRTLGLVSRFSRATTVTATAGRTTGGLVLRVQALRAAIRAGSAQAGTFGSSTSVRTGSTVTLRITVGRGFAGERVEVLRVGAGGKTSVVATRTVGADGIAWSSFPARSGLTAYRVRYRVAADLALWPTAAPPIALSALVRVRGT